MSILSQSDFIKLHRKEQRTVLCSQIVLFIFFIFAWEIGARYNFIDDFIFSSPSRILFCLYDMILDQTIFLHLGITLFETLLSFFLINVFCISIALLLWLLPLCAKILEPYFVLLNSLPKTALAPVLIVWLGNNMKTIIVAAISVALFGSIITIHSGFKEVDPDKIKLIYTLGGNKKDVLWKVILPSNIPLIISTMKVNIGLSLVGVIIGEFLAAKSGLGYLIIYGSQVFRMDLVILSIVILCILSLILYGCLELIEKAINKYFS